MRGKKRVFWVMLAVLALVASTVGTAVAQDPGQGNVNFTVMNMDETQSANGSAMYVDQNGDVSKTITFTIPAQSSQGFPIDSSGLPDNWAGSVIVEADMEIVAFGQARWEGGAYGDGKTAGAYNGFTQGSIKLYFPSLAARSGKQFSSLTVQSAEAASTTDTITFDITFYNRDGTVAETLSGESVHKGAQKTYNLLDQGLPNTAPAGDGWLGAAVVTSSSPIVGVATMHWKEYSAAYSGVVDGAGGQTAYLPSATRRLPSGPWLQYTAVLVQNLDTTTAANVTVKWYDRLGTKLFEFNDTIPANSSHGYNTRWTNSDVPDHAALHGALGTNWNGSVVVQATNAVDIVAVANLQWTSDSPVGTAATAYASEASGYTKLFVPANFRRVDAGTWKQFTGLIVQNIGGAACTNFQVQWFDRSGTKLLDYTDSLDRNISHGYNTAYGSSGSDFPSGVDVTNLGDDFRGSVYINAPGCELIAIHNTLWPLWTDSTTYNAFGK